MVPVSRFNAIIRAATETALALEDELAAIYARAIRTAGRAYAAAYDTTAVVAAADWTPPDALPELDPDLLEAARLKREQAAAALEQTLTERVAGLAISFDPATFKVFSPALLEPLAQHASDAFTAEMRDLTARAIRESFDAGLSVPDTAKAIRSVATVASKATATMLARTDLIGLANGGSFLTAKLVYAGEPAYKTWQNAHDARVRPSHVQAQGQTVPMDAPFRVGGFELMYPGDPQGPPGEVIQCRCTFTVEDALVSAEDAPKTAGELLSQSEQQAVADYTGYGTMGQGYVSINGQLRGNVTLRGEKLSEVRSRIALLDAAVAKAPPLRSPQTVFRAFADPPKVEVGSILEDKGFMSTSSTRALPESWAGTHGDIWEIRLPAGTKALDLNATVREGLINAEEREILLGRGSRLVVEKVEERVTVYPQTGNRVVAHNIRARLENA